MNPEPTTQSPSFRRDDPVEVLVLAGANGQAWFPAEYDGLDGSRHRVRVPTLGGCMTVDGWRVRAKGGEG